MVTSLWIFAVTLIFSLPLGLLISFGRMSKNKIISTIFKLYISVMRGTPLMLQLMVIYFGPFYILGVQISQSWKNMAVAIGFVLNYAAYFAEIYRGGIESMPQGQYEAAKILGYTKAQTFIRIILPQVIKRILPAITNETITLVKDTSLAFTIGVTEMFTMAKALASGQVSMGAGSLADAAQSLAEGATEQAGAVQELQATITNIASMVDNTAEHTKNSSRQAQEYSAKADEGRTEMNHLMEIMGRINETSEKISNIIGEIEDIASQTNLLSLNASIEAARAGEAGRGFAVVADQIGKLAEQSAQSAVNTRNLIGDTLEEIHAGNEAVDHASQTLSVIVDGVRKIAQDSEELNQIAATQADAMNQAESGVNQISEIVQSNSAAAEELSATSEELLAQSENMTNLVKQFKLIDEEKIQARKKEVKHAGI